jgi:hypothetical protein
MKLRSCPYEKELTAALRNGTWPQACGDELRDHVSGCRDCNDVVLITQTLRQARAEAASTAPVPPAGLLWWRAQLQRRNAALERMNQPVVLTGKIALGGTVGAAIALALLKTRDVSGWLHWIAQLPSSDAFRLDTLFAPSPGMVNWAPELVIVGLAAVALFGGVAVYLFNAKE